VRGNTTLYEAVRAIRARSQEAAYLRLRETYARTLPGAFAGLGTDGRSRELLRSAGRIPSTTKARENVRIFIAATDNLGGPRLVSSLTKTFNCVVADFADYPDGYDRRSQSWRAWYQRAVVERFVTEHTNRPFDLVLAYGSRAEFDSETLQRIRRSGVLVALMCLDDKHTFVEDPRHGFPNGQLPLVGSADVHLTNSLECVRWYLAEGAAAYYMPQGVDTKFFAPRDVAQDIDVSFVGQRYGRRAKFVSLLRTYGVRVACYGPGWGTRILSESEKVEMSSRSRINLGVAGVAYSDRITCVKGRDFEVPAAGGLYLTTYSAELANLFRIGEDILCYLNDVDCVEQIRYYLSRPDEARAISEAGRRRCLEDHTWNRRINDFLVWAGVTSPA
jgi:hypothetical protein